MELVGVNHDRKRLRKDFHSHRIVFSNLSMSFYIIAVHVKLFSRYLSTANTHFSPQINSTGKLLKAINLNAPH
jgi:hypothetical protein